MKLKLVEKIAEKFLSNTTIVFSLSLVFFLLNLEKRLLLPT